MSINTLVEYISDSLIGIREAMEKPTGATLSAFHEIASVLDEIRSRLCKGIPVSIEYEDE